VHSRTAHSHSRAAHLHSATAHAHSRTVHPHRGTAHPHAVTGENTGSAEGGHSWSDHPHASTGRAVSGSGSSHGPTGHLHQESEVANVHRVWLIEYTYAATALMSWLLRGTPPFGGIGERNGGVGAGIPSVTRCKMNW
jgi:hypothetical protein